MAFFGFLKDSSDLDTLQNRTDIEKIIFAKDEQDGEGIWGSVVVELTNGTSQTFDPDHVYLRYDVYRLAQSMGARFEDFTMPAENEQKEQAAQTLKLCRESLEIVQADLYRAELATPEHMRRKLQRLQQEVLPDTLRQLEDVRKFLEGA